MVDKIKEYGKLLKGQKLYIRHPTSATSPTSSTSDRSLNLFGPPDLNFPICEILCTHFPFVNLWCTKLFPHSFKVLQGQHL